MRSGAERESVTVSWGVAATGAQVEPLIRALGANPLKLKELKCGPMPNVMVALPNIADALCSTRKVWLTPTTNFVGFQN